ncbi:hypothetical protein PT974_04155 [Cladobotryum mycophilum]|uniref:Hpc2-related domain-containing protein n=1 Tax=Cladobotryum mycophilum TaxID=491253 RepID=A0ABR0SUC6_9HYPO
MATAGDTSTRFDSSAGELSSPPSGSLSEPGSPSRHTTRRFNTASHHSKPDMDEIIVSDQQQSQGSYHQYAQVTSGSAAGGRAPPQKRYSMINGEWVQVTAAGVPRKKPGRKPGAAVKQRQSTGSAEVLDQSRSRKARKSRDASTPPIQRKRKLAPASDADTDIPSPRPIAPASSAVPSPSPSFQPPPQHLIEPLPSHRQQHSLSDQHYSPKIPKRDSFPSSMQSILNADPPPSQPSSNNNNNNNNTSSSTSIPVRTSGQSYDPIRGNYDPVRETITPHSHNHYPPPSGSPRAPLPTQPSHRSPSIASMIEPQAPTPKAPTKASPSHPHSVYPPSSSQPRLQAPEISVPPSPPYAPKTTTSNQTPPLNPPFPAPAPVLVPVSAATLAPTPPAPRPVPNHANFTTIASGPVKKVSPKQKPIPGISTPKTDNLDDAPQETDERSILDFGKARPGEEKETPTIVLSIPITAGETNKYVNFMRMAEDQYGWDALHPRLAANRDRKARIAAAAASLEKTESGRESGDEMSVDLSDGEGSNPDNGGTSGADAIAKPKKKRNFKEDQYDVDDDFVDDSEMLWEAQAAASRDGFFVYSGPLVPEVEKPPAGHEGPPKRGRGGRGSRGGGRGATARAGTAAGRGGGPGSRGGSITRKPRITKSEKAQREREKAERESLAKTSSNTYALQPITPSLSVRELGA